MQVSVVESNIGVELVLITQSGSSNIVPGVTAHRKPLPDLTSSTSISTVVTIPPFSPPFYHSHHHPTILTTIPPFSPSQRDGSAHECVRLTILPHQRLGGAARVMAQAQHGQDGRGGQADQGIGQQWRHLDLSEVHVRKCAK